MKEKIQNRVDAMGYLRENNLEMKSTPKGRVIQGSITLAFDNLNSLRIDVYAMEKSAEKGTENKAFKSLCNLLPSHTITIKSQLDAQPSATFDTVKDVVSKISAHGEFREYAVRDDKGKEVSRVKVQLGNWFDSIHFADPNKPFEPEAKFTVDAFIESIRPEMKAPAQGEEPEETGRYLISALTPDYKGTMYRISYVTEEGAVSQYIANNWRERESTYLTGVVSNLMKVEQKPGTANGFGQAAAGATSTTFVDERIIRGGGESTIDADEYGMEQAGFTSEDVKKGLIARDSVIADNTARKAEKSNNSGSVSTPPAASKNFGFGNAGATAAPSTGFDPKGF